jgi:hypothetical protein
MEFPRVEYKGYTIMARPVCGTDGKWFGGYEILKDSQPVSRRENILPSFLYVEGACTDSIEHAKLEIDNRVSEPPDLH